MGFKALKYLLGRLERAPDGHSMESIWVTGRRAWVWHLPYYIHFFVFDNTLVNTFLPYRLLASYIPAVPNQTKRSRLPTPIYSITFTPPQRMPPLETSPKYSLKNPCPASHKNKPRPRIRMSKPLRDIIPSRQL